MLKSIKRAVLGGFKATGMFSLMRRSQWRQERLLILAYHGLSLDDEHIWNPELFMSPDVFRARMLKLKSAGYTVLPLETAIDCLYDGILPKNCVALTFDDGYYDFYRHAHPILKEIGFPVTLYLTTSYVYYNRPVFEEIIPYLLWKGRQRTLSLGKIIQSDQELNLSSFEQRMSAKKDIIAYAKNGKLSIEEKDTIAALLASQIGVDYEELCERRILHLLRPEEAGRLTAEGVDIQLHTHNHFSPLDRGLFRREIEDNRKSILEMTGTQTRHFCYPSGFYHQSFLPWLTELSVRSATTCDVGLASKNSNRFLLPRLVDTSLCSLVEFEGWLTGVSTFLPRGNRDLNTPA